MDTSTSLLRKPAALIPLIMALIMLALPPLHVARFGLVHQTDEGTAAHIFQLLAVLQMPFVAFFAIRWLPQAPKQALMVIALQVAVVVIAFAEVFMMESLTR
jgi:hypothetical protein